MSGRAAVPAHAPSTAAAASEHSGGSKGRDHYAYQPASAQVTHDTPVGLKVQHGTGLDTNDVVHSSEMLVTIEYCAGDGNNRINGD